MNFTISFARREAANAGLRQPEDAKSPQRIIQGNEALPVKLWYVLL